MGRWGDGEMGRWGDGEMGRMGVNKWCYGCRDLLVLFSGSHRPSSSLAPLLPSPRKRIANLRRALLGLAIAALSLGCQATPVSVDYDLRVPEGTPPVEGWPVIVAVHGLRGNGPDTCDTWADIAAREGICWPVRPSTMRRGTGSLTMERWRRSTRC
jgi:hypothetical protein